MLFQYTQQMIIIALVYVSHKSLKNFFNHMEE